VGDKIIVIAYTSIDVDSAKSFQPKIVLLDGDNSIVDEYRGLQ